MVAAASGWAALGHPREESFDLILLDLLMPDMNGLEMLERLKGRAMALHRVIMISGLSETDAVIRCIEAGAEDYLPKPFNLVLLRARINACLERKRWRDREQEYLSRLQAEKERSEALLRNILPSPIVWRLNAGETIIADRFEDVSILFADLVGFTPAAARMTPPQLVERLNRVFSSSICWRCSSASRRSRRSATPTWRRRACPSRGPGPRGGGRAARSRHARSARSRSTTQHGGSPIRMRIGIHTGPVVAGIIGHHKFIYDVWGDTVNVASRLESNSLPGRIQVSEAVRRLLAERYKFEPRGPVALKGRGFTETFLLTSFRRNRRQLGRPKAAGTTWLLLLCLDGDPERRRAVERDDQKLDPDPSLRSVMGVTLCRPSLSVVREFGDNGRVELVESRPISVVI